MNAALIISVAVFFSILLLLAGMIVWHDDRRKRRDIVEKIKGPEDRLVPDRPDSHASPEEGGLSRRFHRLISSLGQRMKPEDEEELSGVRLRLIQAGYRGHNAVYVYFGYKVFLAVSLAILSFAGRAFLVKTIQPGSFMSFAVVLSLIGFYLPNLWVKVKTGARQEKILEGFPDALDLMVVCVEAGMALDATINRVGEEMRLRNKVVSDEFRLMGLELRAGKLRRDALKNLGTRTGLDDVKSLMTLLIQTDKFGTSVGQALRVHADSMRTRRYQKAEELAAKLPVKLVFPLVLFILPSLFVVVVGPAVIKVFRVLIPALGGH